MTLARLQEFCKYSVHRVGSGTLVRGVCHISDLGVTVHLASDSGARGGKGGVPCDAKMTQAGYGTIYTKMRRIGKHPPCPQNGPRGH